MDPKIEEALGKVAAELRAAAMQLGAEKAAGTVPGAAAAGFDPIYTEKLAGIYEDLIFMELCNQPPLA